MIVDSLKSLGPEEQLRHLKMRFAQELVDGAEGEEEREVRLSTFFGMVEERGGKVSRATLRHDVNARRAHTDSIGFYSIS